MILDLKPTSKLKLVTNRIDGASLCFEGCPHSHLKTKYKHDFEQDPSSSPRLPLSGKALPPHPLGHDTWPSNPGLCSDPA